MAVFGTPTRTSAISLARYAEIINYTDCAFFGVSHPDNDNYACREIWTKYQRDDIQFHLSEAQAEIEEVIPVTLRMLHIITKSNNLYCSEKILLNAYCIMYLFKALFNFLLNKTNSILRLINKTMKYF